MDFSFWIDDQEFKLTLEERVKNDILVSLGSKTYRVVAEFISPEEILLNIDGKVSNVIISSNSLFYSVYVNGRFFRVEKKAVSQILGTRPAKPRKREVKTSMPGRVVKVFVREGERVEEGQAVLVLEAMKMQNEIKSPQAGMVTRIAPRSGESVETGALLFTVE